jgi:4-hydroxybenzoyl-CoA reductase subunit beta
MRQSDEIVTEVALPRAAGWKSVYWKLRRRGAFDFPVLGVAVAVRRGGDGRVEEARVVLGAVASCPLVTGAGDLLVGQKLSDEVIEACGAKAASAAKPMDNTDLDLYWRKEVVSVFVAYALREIRGDDLSATRWRFARRSL